MPADLSAFEDDEFDNDGFDADAELPDVRKTARNRKPAGGSEATAEHRDLASCSKSSVPYCYSGLSFCENAVEALTSICEEAKTDARKNGVPFQPTLAIAFISKGYNLSKVKNECAEALKARFPEVATSMHILGSQLEGAFGRLADGKISFHRSTGLDRTEKCFTYLNLIQQPNLYYRCCFSNETPNIHEPLQEIPTFLTPENGVTLGICMSDGEVSTSYLCRETSLNPGQYFRKRENSLRI